MIKLLIGGSPCTYWSIAQKNNRETQAEGLGWELFKNYIIAKEKFKPDFFLYENNKSASQAIKDQIKKELKVWDGSILTEDSGVRYIEINSALVSAQNRQRFYVHNCGEVQQPIDRGIRISDILENNAGKPINICNNEKTRTIKAQYQQSSIANFVTNGGHDATGVAQRIPTYSNQEKARPVKASYANKGAGQGSLKTECFPENPNKEKSDYIAEHVRVGALPRPNGSQQPVYEVKDGQITIKDKQYPIKLADGYYTIRKLTVTECARLQTMPDNYCKAVSDSQAYKGLGNGWTAEVIIHILNGALKDIPRDEEIVVLSMYDGIGTGRYCLDKMGFTNVKYYAYEIDKYAMTVAKDNYPDIIECGDAFQVRNENWRLYD